jgi:two-component system OmpR family sensor kinase
VPIRWRLTLFNALAMGTILMLLGLSLFVMLRGALFSNIEDASQKRALEVARVIEAGGRLSQMDISHLAINGFFVVVRDEQGRTLTQTPDLASQNGSNDDPIWRQAVDTGQSVGGTANLSPAAPDYVYAVPVNPPNSPARVVEVGKSYEFAAESVDTFVTVLVIGILAAFLLSVGGAYLLARASLSPVDAVVASAREITESDLSKRLPVTRPRDEIGRLATTINGLLSRLEAAFAHREEALVRREEALSRQRRFVADASHELRTPLTSIGGHARMLEQWALQNPEAARKSVAAILRESERMRELVENLLALARSDEGVPMEPKLQDLGAVADEAVKLARAVDGGVAVRYTPQDRPVNAIFDRNRIRQATTILLDNAIKYTPEGGKVTVEVFERNGWAQLEVSDTGIGISKEHLPLIFERFYRADPARTAGGAGLGLAIARQVAEAHGGNIDVRSEPGKGSTFVLRIPRDGPTP